MSSAIENIDLLKGAKHLQLVGIMTHLADAEHSTEFSDSQKSDFETILEQVHSAFEVVHLANSAGAARFRQSLSFSVRAITRIGIGLYGYGIPQSLLQDGEELKPVMTLKSKITSIKKIEAGETVSYGRKWMATQSSNIAVVAIGYADGVSRAFSNIGTVTIRDRQYSIVGTICMDMLMVNLGPKTDIKIGDDVILFGQNGPSGEKISELIGTIPYELVCSVSARVKRLLITDI